MKLAKTNKPVKQNPGETKLKIKTLKSTHITISYTSSIPLEKEADHPSRILQSFAPNCHPTRAAQKKQIKFFRVSLV